MGNVDVDHGDGVDGDGDDDGESHLERERAVVAEGRVTLGWWHLNGESTYKADSRHINESLPAQQ